MSSTAECESQPGLGTLIQITGLICLLAARCGRLNEPSMARIVRGDRAGGFELNLILLTVRALLKITGS